MLLQGNLLCGYTTAATPYADPHAKAVTPGCPTATLASAVECVTSAVWIHQARHRKLSQELLDLKGLYWDGRSLVSGKRPARSPHEHLGLWLLSYDPWELLQMAPAGLAQHLAIQQVAA